MKALDDIKIVEMFFARDQSALVHTSQKYGTRLRNLSYGIVRDIGTAEECENDTYKKAWDSIPPNEPNDYLYAFLARIARNISLNCCRDRNRLKRSAYICELSDEMQQCIPSPDTCESKIDDLIFAEALNTFLSSLSQQKRAMFLRRYWFMDSIEDIAKRFRCSESKVKTTLFRTRNKLRDYLEKEGIDL